MDVQFYTVPIRTTTPDAASADLFLEDMNNPMSDARPNIVFTEIQMSTFLTDQVTYLREIWNIQAAQMADPAICEIAFLRCLGYRQRLINGAIALPDYHIRYNNAKVSNPLTAGSTTAWE